MSPRASRLDHIGVGLLALSLAGCTPDIIANQTEERSGDVSVLLINNTDARALLTFGAFDSLNRNPPGQVALQQRILEARTSLDPITLACARNVAFGTQELLERIRDTDADNTANFIPEAFVEGVFFSSAPLGSEAEALPTAGTAEAFEARLGVDYSCGDRLVIRFEADEAAPGGFRVEFSVIRDEEDDF